MRSRYFTDTQGLDASWRDGAPDQISVCLRLSRVAYERALQESWRRGLTSGAYIEWLLLQQEREGGNALRYRNVPVEAAAWPPPRVPRWPG